MSATTHCSQCGQSWDSSACGPTHAIVAAERADKEAQIAEVMRLLSDRLIVEYDYGFAQGSKRPPAKAMYARMDEAHAALEAAVRKLAGLNPADSETPAPVEKV